MRVLFEPRASKVRSGLAVVGGTLRLESFGKTSSVIKPNSELQARLIFNGAFIAKARKMSSPSFKPFASLAGTLKIDGRGQPSFLLAPDVKLVQPEPAPDQRPRRLKLEYAASHFQNLPADTSAIGDLRLPKGADTDQFFELGVELEVSGNIEATVTQNDRLDVPLDAITFLEIEVLDEEDQPIAGRACTVELGDGTTVNGQTDDKGVLSIDPIPRGRCVLKLE